MLVEPHNLFSKKDCFVQQKQPYYTNSLITASIRTMQEQSQNTSIERASFPKAKQIIAKEKDSNTLRQATYQSTVHHLDSIRFNLVSESAQEVGQILNGTTKRNIQELDGIPLIRLELFQVTSVFTV